MGYLHDDFDYNFRPRRRSRQGGSVWRTMMLSFFSACVGGFLAILLLPTLAKSGMLPFVLESRLEERMTALESLNERQPASPVNVEAQRSGSIMEISEDTAMVQAVQKVEKAIVGVINVEELVDSWSSNTQVVEHGTGSGIIFDREGNRVRLVTNYHVIEGAVEGQTSVEISLPSGERVEATVIGADQMTDLAVLEIQTDDQQIKLAEFGDSQRLKVGEPVLAIGNPLGLEFSRSVTKGIISSLDRTVPVDLDNNGQAEWEFDVLQTDAAINPGNSGGALVNAAGRVIGINSLKISHTGVEGLGFAIPANDAVPIIHDLIEYGEVQRPYLGIGAADLQAYPSRYWKRIFLLPPEVKQGVVVEEVVRYSPASEADLRQYDVIVRLDETLIPDSLALRKFLYNQKTIGDVVKVTFYRQGEQKETMLQLSGMPW